MAEKKNPKAPAPVKGPKKPTKKCHHIKGSRKNPQDMLTLIIAGKGRMFKHFPEFKGSSYAGTSATFGSFNMAQAQLNRANGLLD